MKQQCSKCGTWCESQKRSFIQKAGDGFAKTKDSFAKFGEGIGEKIGGKDGGTVGKIVGDSIGDKTPAPYLMAASEALFGDKYVFECPQCGHKWTQGEEDAPSKNKQSVNQQKTSIAENLEKPIVNKKRIFISYKRVNASQVYKLKERIEQTLGEECFYDKKDIESSSFFPDRICKAIVDAKVVLFMYSKAHLNIDYENDWTNKELNVALGEHKKIVLVNLDKAPLKGRFLAHFGDRDNIDSQDPEQWDKLMNDMRRWLNLNSSVSAIQGETKYKEEPSSTHGVKYALGRLANIGSKINSRETKHYLEKLYIKGKEIKEKGEEYLVEAAESYRVDAVKGDARAQYKLGRKYKLGSGVTKDYGEAVRWFQKSAEQDYPNAQYELGFMYEYGYGVDKDISLARYWYQRAAEQGDKDAKKALTEL